ncbi:MAG: segregation/condensation protein A [Nitrospinota bacterium]|jgi:segregation and condensation protein A|nr:segregation/condensation protein A [Nitrospinota bacterium]
MTYKVRLEIFEGPLDLLLHLIRENQVNIYDIPIARITDQYLDYLKFMKTLNIEVAGEFLVMAATLTHIKSRMLLPCVDEEAVEEEDPRRELVDRLLEYRRFKEIAGVLQEREAIHGGIHRRALSPDSVSMPDEPVPAETFLGEVGIFDLLKAFENIMRRIGDMGRHEIEVDEMELDERLTFVLNRVRSEGTTFTALFERMARRIEITSTFLAMLELIRQRLIRVRQNGIHGAIYIYPEAAGND